MRMWRQLLSQISGFSSRGLPVAASGEPGRRPHWNEVLSLRLLATHDIWACMNVIVREVFEVKGGGPCFCPKTQLPPLPCYLFPTLAPLPTLLQLDHVSHLPIHLKNTKYLLRSNMGLRQGSMSGPLSRGGKHSNNKMKKRKWRRREGRGGLCSDLRQEMASNSFFGSLCSFHSLPLSAAFTAFLVFSSLMRCSMGRHWDCEVWLAWPVVLQRGKGGSNQAQLLCVHVCMKRYTVVCC